jgi:beta-glucosidase
VPITLDRTALAYWDDARHAWVAEAGEFELLVGSSSQHIRGRATFHLTGSVSFGGPSGGRITLGVDSTLKALIEDPEARAVLERYLPEGAMSMATGMGSSLTLGQVSGFAPDLLPDETLNAIAAGLRALAEGGDNQPAA